MSEVSWWRTRTNAAVHGWQISSRAAIALCRRLALTRSLRHAESGGLRCPTCKERARYGENHPG